MIGSTPTSYGELRNVLLFVAGMLYYSLKINLLVHNMVLRER